MAESIDTLDARLTRLEDHQSIETLIASYGPAVDTLDAMGIKSLWANDGSYGIGPELVLSGAGEIGGIAGMDQHRGYVRNGCAHILSRHRIAIDGNEAVAQGYSLVMMHDKTTGRWQVERCSANRWTLRKGPKGWQTIHRQADLLDGSDTARALLGWREPIGDAQ